MASDGEKNNQKHAAKFKEVAKTSTSESELGLFPALYKKQYHCVNVAVKTAKDIKNFTNTVHHTAFNTKSF